ncbi:hypothetical protein GCM10023147_25400 [Tsukamurella soli]|uniref:M23ase beta-sheet core domain-containing protein n=1 Tax=Tsukamurella soli TaxID=644556 RepID=A0ABP8JPK5_9ACTN
MAHGDGSRTRGTQLLDGDSVTSIIPVDELEQRLQAAYGQQWEESWVTEDDHDAEWAEDDTLIVYEDDETGNAFVYEAGTAEITQDIVIPVAVLRNHVDTHQFRIPTPADLEATAPAETAAVDVVAPAPVREVAPAEIPVATPKPVRGAGRHRLAAPPQALKGRVALLALAAGATMTGAALGAPSAKAPHGSPVAPLTQEPSHARAAALPAPQDMEQFGQALPDGAARKAADDAAIAATERPLFVLPAHGEFTSVFGGRWGTMHAGVDIAAPIGTPIVAVEDGTIISAGPASGFGLWVRLQAADGTITVYGHVNTMTVTVGQKVMAGDQIATIGNRGDSTGPHLHFEVWQNGTTKIDPLPWLAARGISLGNYVG